MVFRVHTGTGGGWKAGRAGGSSVTSLLQASQVNTDQCCKQTVVKSLCHRERRKKKKNPSGTASEHEDWTEPAVL